MFFFFVFFLRTVQLQSVQVAMRRVDRGLCSKQTGFFFSLFLFSGASFLADRTVNTCGVFFFNQEADLHVSGLYSIFCNCTAGIRRHIEHLLGGVELN